MFSKSAIFLALSSCLLFAFTTAHADSPKLHRSGSVVIDQGQVGYIVTAGLGGGTLHVANRSYSFKIGGLGVGGVGVSHLKAIGTVYNLGAVDDFSGSYLAVRTGIAVGDMGGGKLWLKNSRGVYMELQVKRKGLMLSTGIDGMVITMK